jgi:hypothetical protein
VLPPLVAGCAPEGVTTEGRAAHDAYNGFLMAAAFVFGVVAIWLLVGALPPPQRGAAAADPRQPPGTTNEFDMNFQGVGLCHGQCAQFSRVNYAEMLCRVKVVSQDQFDRFLTSGRAARPPAAGPREHGVQRSWQPSRFRFPPRRSGAVRGAVWSTG